MALVAMFVGSGLAVAHPVPAAPAHGGGSVATATLYIYPDGSVSTPGILGVSGNTYTLLANYNGSIADERNGSILDGAQFVVYCSACDAGVWVYGASQVTVERVHVGAPVGIAVELSSQVDLANNSLVAVSNCVRVANSTAIIAQDNYVQGSSGFLALQTSDLLVRGNEFASSSGNGIEINDSASVRILDNDLVGSTGESVVVYRTDGIRVQGNNLSAPVSGNAVLFSLVSSGNLSDNNLTGAAAPVEFDSVVDVAVSNNRMDNGIYTGYAVFSSTRVTISDSTATGSVYQGILLYADVDSTLRQVDVSGGALGVYIDLCSGVLVDGSRLGSGVLGMDIIQSVNISVVGSDLVNPNDGIHASDSSRILVLDSNLSRANTMLALSGGTHDVRVEASDLDQAQIEAVTLDNVSQITISNSTIRRSADAAIIATTTEELAVTGSNLSGSPTAPGFRGIVTHDDSGIDLTNDSIAWTSAPFVDIHSKGIRISSVDFAHATGTDAVALTDDLDVAIRSSDFTSVAATGIDAFGVTDLSVTDSIFDGAGSNGVQASSISRMSLTDNSFDRVGSNGLYLLDGFGVVASGNSANGADFGFFLVGGGDITLAANVVERAGSSSVSAVSVVGLNITGNDFSNDSEPGTIAIYVNPVQGISITGNTLRNDDLAVALEGSTTATVIANQFLQDNRSIWIEGIVNALVYHNDFVNDGAWTLSDTGTVRWDDGYPSGGNFWSNYSGPDLLGGSGQNVTGADGLGDLPMSLLLGDVDRYPLTTPWVQHLVMFVQHGLPMGLAWGIAVNGNDRSTQSGSIVVEAVSGVASSFNYTVDPVAGYSSSPSQGAGVLGEGAVLVAIDFQSNPPNRTGPGHYEVRFHETGLPNGTEWSVTFNGSLASTSNDTAIFVAINGSYAFAVGAIAGYSIRPSSGAVTVAGTPVPVEITFTVVTYRVTVSESGLPAGTVWGLVVDGASSNNSEESQLLSLANGTYAVAPGGVVGYSVAPRSYALTVAGGPVTLTVVYTAASSSLPPSTSPIPSLSNAQGTTLFWGIIAALAIAAVAGWYLALRRTRGSTDGTPPHPPPPTQPPAPPSDTASPGPGEAGGGGPQDPPR
jgi:hypothetical protein